ncbi:MAG: cyclophilin-like fold protein [Haloarculaceae archaeon]
MTDLRIDVDGRGLDATWTDENPETQSALADALPLAGDATRWGDELYFRTGVEAPAEDAREAVPEGAVAYWPGGNAVCLFWGPTPASRGDEPRAAAPVNVVATVDDVSALSDLDGAASVRVERA